MAEQEAPQTPDEPPNGSDPPRVHQETQFETVEVHLEYQQRLPGGAFRWSRHSVTRRSHAPQTQGSRISLRSGVILIVFITIVIIGLVAVGPQGVWEEFKTLLPDLFGSD